jgi:Ni/Co efflux regulator RcnB
MTRNSLLKTATLSLLIGAMTIPSMASAAPQSRGTEYNQRDARVEVRDDRRDERRDDRSDARRDYRDDRRDERRDERSDARRDERRDDRRDHRHDDRRSAYKYGYGAFNAPFRAQQFRAGDRMGHNMMSGRYMINNPRAIDLPFAGRNKAYVRHYNDVLLVNLRSGKVIAVYRNHLRW